MEYTDIGKKAPKRTTGAPFPGSLDAVLLIKLNATEYLGSFQVTTNLATKQEVFCNIALEQLISAYAYCGVLQQRYSQFRIHK